MGGVVDGSWQRSHEGRTWREVPATTAAAVVERGIRIGKGCFLVSWVYFEVDVVEVARMELRRVSRLFVIWGWTG